MLPPFFMPIQADTGLSGLSGTAGVASDKLSFTLPASATAGTAFAFTVTAVAPNGSTDTGYTGTVNFTSGDQQASVPLPGALTAGVGVFTAILMTTGSQAITGTDSVTGSIRGNASVTVSGTNKFISSAWDFLTQGNEFADLYIGTSTDGFSFGTLTKITYSIPYSVACFRDFQLPLVYGKAYLLADTGNTTNASNFFGIISTDDLTNAFPVGNGQVVLGLNQVIDPKLRMDDAGVPWLVYLGSTDSVFNHLVPYISQMIPPYDFQQWGPATPITTDGTFSFPLGASDIQLYHKKGGLFYLMIGANQVTGLNFYTSSNISGPYSQLRIGATEMGNSTMCPVVNLAGNTWNWYCDPFNYQLQALNAANDWESGLVPAGAYTFGASTAITRTGTVTFASPSVSVYAALAPNATAARYYLRTNPATPRAGVGFIATVTALDVYNHLAGSYSGTVKFATSDTTSTLPANSTLSRGVGIFSMTLNAAGTQNVTITDTVSATITSSLPVFVTLSKFTFTVPTNATAGTAFPFTITASGTSSGVDTSYSGTVLWTSSDTTGYATLPPNGTFANGVGIFTATITTSGNQTITGTDSASTITGTSGNVNVAGLTSATKFLLTVPATATSGVNMTFTVKSTDQFNNTTTGYTGTVTFASSGSGAIMPANNTLSAGVGTFSATLGHTGNTVLTATDISTATITGTSSLVNVVAGVATHFTIPAPTAATAGTKVSLIVQAKDFGNNTATSYSGTVTMTCGDSQAVLPANFTLVAGSSSGKSVTLKTAGTIALTATDTVHSTLTGTGSCVVVAAPVSQFIMTTVASVTPGVGSSLTIIAADAFNNTNTGYGGMVHFTSSDTAASLPGDTGLGAGSGSFNYTLNTVGSQTITATDTLTATITGNTGTITVGSSQPTHFAVTGPTNATAGAGFPFTVTAQDGSNSTVTGYTGTVAFTAYDTSSLVSLPASATLTNGVGTFSATLFTQYSQTITATDTVSATLTGACGTISVAPRIYLNENFEGSSSMPTGWSSSGATVSVDTSAGWANSLKFSGLSGNSGFAWKPAAVDSNGSQCVVRGRYALDAGGGNNYLSIIAGAQANPSGNTPPTSVRMAIDLSGGDGMYIQALPSFATLARNTAAPAFSTGTAAWYEASLVLQLAPDGAYYSIAGYLQRVSDGAWLQANGVWNVGAQTCCIAHINPDWGVTANLVSGAFGVFGWDLASGKSAHVDNCYYGDVPSPTTQLPLALSTAGNEVEFVASTITGSDAGQTSFAPSNLNGSSFSAGYISLGVNDQFITVDLGSGVTGTPTYLQWAPILANGSYWGLNEGAEQYARGMAVDVGSSSTGPWVNASVLATNAYPEPSNIQTFRLPSGITPSRYIRLRGVQDPVCVSQLYFGGPNTGSVVSRPCPPTCTPAGGMLATSGTITLQTNTATISGTPTNIYYNVGTTASPPADPTATSTAYSGAITVPAHSPQLTIIKAVASNTALSTHLSRVATFQFMVGETFTPDSGVTRYGSTQSWPCDNIDTNRGQVMLMQSPSVTYDSANNRYLLIATNGNMGYAGDPPSLRGFILYQCPASDFGNWSYIGPMSLNIPPYWIASSGINSPGYCGRPFLAINPSPLNVNKKIVVGVHMGLNGWIGLATAPDADTGRWTWNNYTLINGDHTQDLSAFYDVVDDGTGHSRNKLWIVHTGVTAGRLVISQMDPTTDWTSFNGTAFTTNHGGCDAPVVWYKSPYYYLTTSQYLNGGGTDSQLDVMSSNGDLSFSGSGGTLFGSPVATSSTAHSAQVSCMLPIVGRVAPCWAMIFEVQDPGESPYNFTHNRFGIWPVASTTSGNAVNCFVSAGAFALTGVSVPPSSWTLSYLP